VIVFFITQTALSIDVLENELRYKKSKKISVYLSGSMSRGLDYYKNPDFNFFLQANYALFKKYSLNLSSTYSSSYMISDFSKNYYGIGNLRLGARSRSLYQNNGYIFDLSHFIKLPLAKSNIYTSFRGSLQNTLNIRKNLGPISVTLSHSLSLNSYKYFTKKSGSTNSRFLVNHSLYVTYPVFKKTSIGLSLGGSWKKSFAGTWMGSQYVSTNLSYLITKNLQSFASFSWGDRIYSHLDFLDDDRTSFSLGLSANF